MTNITHVSVTNVFQLVFLFLASYCLFRMGQRKLTMKKKQGFWITRPP